MSSQKPGPKSRSKQPPRVSAKSSPATAARGKPKPAKKIKLPKTVCWIVKWKSMLGQICFETSEHYCCAKEFADRQFGDVEIHKVIV